ncbi:IclR family transcriptional regulator [Ornithinimicrobium sp. LYQ92]|uniref:IclR family transcriptional regulator n=1 Tax=Serinicoccus sp. LYQ92 TaxID=3378798 RepID=UPI003855662F
MPVAQHRTVSRVIRILELVATRPEGVSLVEVAGHLAAPRSTVHGFLRGLVAEGYIEEGGTPPAYRIGHGAHALLLSRESSIAELTRPLREALLADLDETVTLGVPVADSVVYLESLTPSHSVSYRAPLRVRRPLWPTSCGKIFLADRQDAATVISGQAGDVVQADALRELDTVRDSGFAFNRRESMTEVSAVAIRFEHEGRLLGAISIAGPSGRVKDSLVDYAQHAQELMAASETISDI